MNCYIYVVTISLKAGFVSSINKCEIHWGRTHVCAHAHTDIKLSGFQVASEPYQLTDPGCWWSSVEGLVWPAQQIPLAVNLSFLDQNCYFYFEVTPQLSSWGWVDPVPELLLLRKSGSAGNRTRDTNGKVNFFKFLFRIKNSLLCLTHLKNIPNNGVHLIKDISLM
jgi:hypothetical protein